MGETSDSVRAGAPPPMPLAFFGFATALMGIAFYLIIEVNVTVLRFFKKRGGLYFWCILVASWGTCLHTISFIIQWWVPGAPWVLCAAFGQFGWSFMVTAQSLVLYSRLHLVIRNHKILRGVLIMIITTSIAVEVPNWVTSWFAYDTELSVTELWTPRDNIMLRISQLVLFLQESTLSVLYIWGTVKILAPNDKINVRRIKWDLIAVNSFIIATDLVNVILTYANDHYAKEPIQNFSYAFKLRIEFAVLNQLMAVTSQSRASNYNAGGRYVKDSGWNSSSGGASKPLDRSKPSSDGKSTSQRPSDKSPQSMAALAYGPNSNVPLRHHASDHSGSTSSGGDHELEKLPRARLESNRPHADAPPLPSHENTNDGITVRHDLQQQQGVLHNTASSSQLYGSSENLAPYVHTRAVASPNRESWWDRLAKKVDPPDDERWRRDLSRV